MARKSYAPPVTNFSVSCDPVTLEWLTEYAYKKKQLGQKLSGKHWLTLERSLKSVLGT